MHFGIFLANICPPPHTHIVFASNYLMQSQWSLAALALSHHELRHFLLKKPQLPGLSATALARAELQFSSCQTLTQAKQSWHKLILSHDAQT